MHRRLLGPTLTIVAALVVLAAAIYVIRQNDPVEGAGTTPGSSFSPIVAPFATPGSASLGRPNINATSDPAADTTVVAFLGDDYTAGVGASAPNKRFTTLVAETLHVTEKNFGDDGAGYAKTGADGTTYAGHIDAVVAAHPDVVVVTGGRNDFNGNTATLARDADELFADLHERLPSATLIAVAPFWGDSDYPAKLTDMADAIKAAVEDAGGIYVALPDPLHDHPDFMADNADPNDQGYAAIASALAAKLGPLLPGR